MVGKTPETPIHQSPLITQNPSATVASNIVQLSCLNITGILFFKDGNDCWNLAVICKKSKMYPVIGVDTCQHGYDAVLYTTIALISQSAKDLTVAFVYTKRCLSTEFIKNYFLHERLHCFPACFTCWVWSPQCFWFSNGCLIRSLDAQAPIMD